MNMNFDISEQNEQPVLSMRTRTNVANLPGELGKAYSAINAYVEEIGEKTGGPAFAAYYNMDMEDLDVEIGFPVEKPVAGKGNIRQSAIPAGRQASCMYKGPYADMGPVYEAMTAWMNEKGYVPTGVVYEFYYNSPADVPESELLTKIVFMIK